MVVDALSDLGFTENGEIQSVDKDTPAYEARMINDRENFSVKIFYRVHMQITLMLDNIVM